MEYLLLYYRAHPVTKHTSIDPDTILRRHEHLYDHWNPRLRQEIPSLADLPLFRTDGTVIKIYDEDGNRVVRTRPLCRGAQLGILFDLKTAEELFEPTLEAPSQHRRQRRQRRQHHRGHRDFDFDSDAESEEDEDEEDEEEYVDELLTDSFSLRLFPQAFINTVGHIQASQTLPAFRQVFRSINDLTTSATGDEGSDDDDDREEGPVIRGESFQAYNLLMHRLAPDAGGQDVQHGDITAALAGTYAQGTKDKSRGAEKFTSCNTYLPHERLHHKMDHPECPKDLRLEQVYAINIRALPHQRRRGR
jgi:hypothetical protein